MGPISLSTARRRGDGVGESQEQVHPRVAEAGHSRRSVGYVQRQLVEFYIAGMADGPCPGVDGGQPVLPGIEWLTAKYSHSNTPWVLR